MVNGENNYNPAGFCLTMSLKGAAYERQLKKLLEARGFYVIRSAGSGADSVSPDLLALASTRRMAFECKAWDGGYLWIERLKMEKMREFELKTTIPVYIAWKVSRKDWKFFPLSALKEQEKGYTAAERELSYALKLEDVVS